MTKNLQGLSVLLFCLLESACGGRGPLISNHGYQIEPVLGKLVSWKELNESNVIMQDLDYSCGAASLATLMRYYFGDSVTEGTILSMSNSLFTGGQLDVIKNQGLSFQELETIAISRGYTASSVELRAETVMQIRGPILVYIEPYGYPHFAVLRGVYEGQAYLADPSRGNIRMDFQKFAKEWTGKALVLGRSGFGTPSDYPLAISSQPQIMHELRTARPQYR